jgi:hypothetical protein
MITPPPGWLRSAGANVVTLRPPEGGGHVRYHERLPPARFTSIVAELLAADPGFEVRELGTPARAVTTDGELAAWTTVGGVVDGNPAVRFIGAVFVDEFVAALDAVALSPAAERTVLYTARELLVGASFGLGVRRRRFFYTPPAGWQGLPSGLTATWHHPRFPRHAAVIVVPAAEPCADPAHVVAERFVGDEEARGFIASGPLTLETVAAAGLAAVRVGYAGSWRAGAPPATLEAFIATDGRYRYVVRLESRALEALEADRQTARAVAASVRPLPAHGAGAPASSPKLRALSDLWSE